MTEPRPLSDRRTEVTSVRLDPDVLAELREIADRNECTVSELLRSGARMVLAEPNRMQITWLTPIYVTGPNLTLTAPPTDSRNQAIEAGAKAIGRKMVGQCFTPDGALAEIAYDAMAPHIRRQVAEEIAVWFETEAREGNLEKDRPVQVWTVAEVWQEAARLIREYGARQ